MPSICIVPTGTANLASVIAAVRRAGAEPSCTLDAAAIDRAEGVILPGVGSYAAAMTTLRRANLVDPLRARIERGAPTLAICLGMQLFGRGSDESPDETGLGVIDARCERLRAPRVPQLGWNEVTADANGVVESGWMAFAHSFAFVEPDALRAAGWQVSTATAGAPYVAAFERGAVVACQFHPELSGDAGRTLFARWIALATVNRAGVPATTAEVAS